MSFVPDGSQSIRGPMTLLSDVPGGLPRSSVVVLVTNTSTSQRHLTWRWSKLWSHTQLGGPRVKTLSWPCLTFGERISTLKKRETPLLSCRTMCLPNSGQRVLGSCGRRCTELAQLQRRWEIELRKELVSCGLTVGTGSRCSFHTELCSGAGTVHGGDIFVAGLLQDTATMGATLKKRWETRDQMIGPKLDDQKEVRILNRTLRCCKDGLVFAANLRHGGEGCRRAGTEQVEASLVSGHGRWRCPMPR